MRLLAEDLFHVPGFFLNRASGLIGFAFGLKPFVADRFANSFLKFTFDVFAGSFRLVLIA